MKHDLTLKVRNLKFSILNGVPTSNRCFIARKFGESSKVGTQMTGVIPGAPTDDFKMSCQKTANAYRKDYIKNSRVVPQGQLIEMLEPYDGKLSRTVPRRESGRNARDLSGTEKIKKYLCLLIKQMFDEMTKLLCCKRQKMCECLIMFSYVDKIMH